MSIDDVPPPGRPGREKEVLGALREASRHNPRLVELPPEEVARQLVLEGLVLQRHLRLETRVEGVTAGTGALPVSVAKDPLCAICCSGSRSSATARTPPRAGPSTKHRWREPRASRLSPSDGRATAYHGLRSSWAATSLPTVRPVRRGHRITHKRDLTPRGGGESLRREVVGHGELAGSRGDREATLEAARGPSEVAAGGPRLASPGLVRH